MPSDLNIALIGYGLAGRVFHAPLIQHTPGLRLHRIVSSRREEVRRHFTDVETCETPEAAFSDLAVDAIVIATPNSQHAPLALAALRAGKHVLVDKPFTLDATQAQEILAVAAANGRIASVFQNRRFDADFLTLKGLLHRGELGDIAELHSHFDRFRPQVRDRWREQDSPGGGLWYDLAPHLLDQILQLFGWPQAISVDLDCQRGEGSTDYLHAVLHYPGMRAIAHAGSLVSAVTPRFAVHGRLGSWTTYGLDVQEAQLAAGIAPGAPGWGMDPRHGERSWIDAEGQLRQVTVDNIPGDYRQLYSRFAAALRGEGEPEVTPAQALQLMQLLDAGRRSADEGRTVTLATNG